MMLLSELNTLPDFTPVNASSFPLPSERITRGRGGRYSLPRTTLSFATFQRLTPTLRTRTRTRWLVVDSSIAIVRYSAPGSCNSFSLFGL